MQNEDVITPHLFQNILFCVVLDDDHFAYTKHEPIGVCGAIIPVSCLRPFSPKLDTQFFGDYLLENNYFYAFIFFVKGSRR